MLLPCSFLCGLLGEDNMSVGSFDRLKEEELRELGVLPRLEEE